LGGWCGHVRTGKSARATGGGALRFGIFDFLPLEDWALEVSGPSRHTASGVTSFVAKSLAQDDGFGRVVLVKNTG
jgi:hypothetical protein